MLELHELLIYDTRMVFVDCAVLYNFVDKATNNATIGRVMYKKVLLLCSMKPVYSVNITGWSTSTMKTNDALSLFNLVSLLVRDICAKYSISCMITIVK